MKNSKLIYQLLERATLRGLGAGAGAFQDRAAPPSGWFLESTGEEAHAAAGTPISPFPFFVGRKVGLGLQLPVESVSPQHAELYVDGKSLWVLDLKSTHGTYVNGRLVEERTELRSGDYLMFGSVEFLVRRDVERRLEFALEDDFAERAAQLAQLELIMQGGTRACFQPVVNLSSRQPMAHELLIRGRQPGLRTPKEMFRVAAGFGREGELSRYARTLGLRASLKLPTGFNLFLNTHPVEIQEPELVESMGAVRDEYQAQALTLEIHESAVVVGTQMRDLRQILADFDIGLAYDDFGAGQARIVELAEVPPDFLKFDMRLIRDIHRAPAGRQKLLSALVCLARDMGITTLAEGVELDAEAEVCAQMGFELAQGFLFGHAQEPGGDTTGGSR